MAKIEFSVNALGALDPNVRGIELRAGDFVKFRSPSKTPVEVKFVKGDVDVSDTFLATQFPDSQTFKLSLPVLKDNKIMVSFQGLKTDPKVTTLLKAARGKKITFTLNVNGATVAIRPNVESTEIRSGAIVQFRRALGTDQDVVVQLGSPSIFFGFLPDKGPVVKNVKVTSKLQASKLITAQFTDEGQGDGATKPFP